MQARREALEQIDAEKALVAYLGMDLYCATLHALTH